MAYYYCKKVTKNELMSKNFKTCITYSQKVVFYSYAYAKKYKLSSNEFKPRLKKR